MDEQLLLIQLKQGDQKAFLKLFNKYYKDLVLFGGNFIPDISRCEDIVESVFLKLWNDREIMQIESVTLKSFLLRSVKNACLNEIRRKASASKYELLASEFNVHNSVDTEHYVLYSELHEHLENALKKLPDNYRECFEMNRLDGMKYKEIAEKLNISERAVETRVARALVLLHKHLKKYLYVLMLATSIL